MSGCEARSAPTDGTTCERTIGGMWCWGSTNASSPRSRLRGRNPTAAGRCLYRRTVAGRMRRVAVRLGVAARASPATRLNVVALDHLVQRRRLDVQELGGALLHSAGGLERRFDQAFFEVGDHFLERDPFGRHDE